MENEDKTLKLKENESLKLIVGAVLVAVFLVGIYFTGNQFLGSRSEMSEGEIRERLSAYIEQTLPDTPASVNSVEKMKGEGVFKIELDIGGQNFTSYTTLDGRFLFPSAIDLDDFLTAVEESEQDTESGEVLGELPQTERPDVKLFVMSYCPYGLQAQKAFLPAWELLKENTEMGIYFVDYIMHEKKEVDENLTQYCIQKEQRDKIISYLDCFVQAGEGELCLAQVGVDLAALDACRQNTDQEFGVTESYENEDQWLNGRYPRFLVHSDLNEQFGVKGSPTLVINGTEVVSNADQCPADGNCFVDPNFVRTPESFKNVVCGAFVEAPEECEQELSDEAPTPSFGGGSTTEAIAGGCGD